jgi:hypothetical protein
MTKSDPTKDPEFQKVVRHFVTTPHKPHEPLKGARGRRNRTTNDASDQKRKLDPTHQSG